MKTGSHYRTVESIGEGRLGTISAARNGKRWAVYLLALIGVSVILVFTTTSAAAVVPINPPILISEPTSTRAIALESVAFTREPFGLLSRYLGASDQRTRVMVFAMNLALQSGEDLLVVSADAEDAAHRHYPLTIESIRPVPSCEWMSAVVFKLNDELGDVGDVLISVSYRSVMSNRVRIGIGHVGGGPADDLGAVPTPAPPYTISGQITGSAGQGLSGISLTLSGAQTGTLVTGNGGFYSFTVTRVGDYTLAPASTQYYTFVPQTFTNLHLNQTANFAGTLRFYTVSGRLTAGSDAAPGVVVPVTGSQTATATTNSNGEYSFSLPAGGNYAITPSLLYYDFLPVSLVVTDLTSDQPNRNFSGTRQTFTISGRLRNQSGASLPGITVNLTGAQQRSTLTDESGNYQFTALPAGFDYTVTPQTNAYYSFTSSQTFTDLRLNQLANFAGTLRFYTVSGRVQLGPNSAPGLVLPISGSQATSVTTDENGNYAISLPAGGNYTVTPSLRSYDFAPVSQVVTDLTSNQINRFFIGTRQTYKISGKFRDQSGNGLAGIAVHLNSAGVVGQWGRVSDQSGYYEFAGLPAGYDYHLTPTSTANYVFEPQSIVDLSSNQTLDFTGLRRLALSGTVRDQSGNGIIGVRVTLSGSESATTTTAADGSYSLTATATGNYTVTPSIGQGWYTFAPAGAQFNNLASAHTTDFIATLAPVPDPSLVLEFDGQPQTVDYGNFWQEGVNLGHFFWEFWAMPGANAGPTYMLSDGYGGAHALLFGLGSFNSSEPNRHEMTGNLFDGVTNHSFGSDQGPAVDEWAHFAVGWDGQNIITYYNGVPVGKTAFAGPRRTPGPGGGGGRLLIGGSDHLNFEGRIAQLRGYEDANPREALPGGVEASFAPQTVFGLEGSLLSYYFRSGGDRVADLSRGYNGVNHGGWVRGTLAGVLFDCGGCPPPQFVIDPSAPNFAANIAPPPVSVPSPATVPSGALVFDSFSRANSTYLFGSRGGLGSTENGSAGTQLWQTNQSPTSPQPFGILNSIAVLLANDAALAWVETGSATGKLDVRVDRRRGRWGRGIQTGLSFRVVDANNFFFAYTNAAQGAPNTQTLKVGYYLDGLRVDLETSAALPAIWTTLTVVTTDAGDVKVYADNTLLYSTNSPLMATATGAGLYNNSPGLGLVNRWDNFTVFNAP